MPLYDYSCPCGHKMLNVMSSVADRRKPTEVPCFKCGEVSVELVVGGAAIVSGVRTNMTPPDGFKDVLGGIHKSAGKAYTINV